MNALLASVDGVSAAWGCAGSLVYATFEARQRLCGGERSPTAQERRRVWGDVLTAPIAGTIAAAALAPTLHHYAPALSVAGVGLVIGVAANPIWPAIQGLLSSDGLRKALAENLSRWAERLRGGGKAT